jgi:hypothetical protein
MVMPTAPDKAGELTDALAAFVEHLDVTVISGEDAARLTSLFARGERLCATAKAMAARRATECRHWAQAGHRSPDQWLAQVSGTTQSAARTSLAIAEQMEAQPELARACQAGELSQAQAGEIAAAAEADPDSTPRLVDHAQRSGLQGLRDSCRQVVIAGRSAEADQARVAAIHRSRYLRYWTDRDGAGRLDARMTPDVLARFQACLRPYQTQQFEMARESGTRERLEAYALDALLAVAEAGHANAPSCQSDVSPGGQSQRGSGPASKSRKVGPPATVIALVDHAALVRGYVEGDECCVIRGIGPVPVATVRAMLSDAFLAAVVADGVDIRSVVHVGRRPLASQLTALFARDRTCVVPDCHLDDFLEVHHVKGWSATKVTTLDDLALLCSHHHDLATYEGWILDGQPGRWNWRPPPGGAPPGPFDDDGIKLRPPPSRCYHDPSEPSEFPLAGPGQQDDPLGLFQS